MAWGIERKVKVKRYRESRKKEKKVQYLYMCVTYYVRVLTSSGVDRINTLACVKSIIL
jgi:hypothetical protein